MNHLQYFQEILSFHSHLPIRIFHIHTKDRHYICPMHQHREPEMLYCLKGTFYVEMQETRYTLNAGDLLFFNPNEAHGTYGDPDNDVICFQMTAEFFSEMSQQVDFLIDRDMLFQDEKKARIGELIKQIDEHAQMKEDGSILKIYSLLFEIAYLLVSRYQKIRPQFENCSQRKREVLNQICAFIREHHRENISLESVADHFSYTSQYLSSLFNQYLNTTFLSYLNALRVDTSVRFLTNTTDSVVQIASYCGFASPKAYNREFKKLYGILPSAYRKIKNRP